MLFKVLFTTAIYSVPCHFSLRLREMYYYIRRITKDRPFITQTLGYKAQALTYISSKMYSTAFLIYDPLCKYLIGMKGIIKYAAYVRSET